MDGTSTQAAPQTVATTRRLAPASAALAVTESGHPRRWGIMAVLGAVAFMAQLDFFVVNVALDGIGRSFPGTGIASVSWVLSAYAIAFAAALVPTGSRTGPAAGRQPSYAGAVGCR